MKKYLFLLFVAVIAWSSLSGQSNSMANPVAKHEYTLYAGGGLSTLRYESSIGARSNLAGGLLGAEYRFFPLKRFGLGVGVEIAFYNVKGLIDNYSYAEITKDPNGADFEFRTTMRNYGERESIVMFNIPFMIHYRGDPEKNAFYAAVGGKLGFPVSGKYRVVEGSSFNSGYYAFEDYEYTDQKFMGFGSFPEFGDQEIKLNPTYMFSLEAGMNWRLQYILLYTGLYFDYALNTIAEKTDKFISSYNGDNPANRQMGSMLNTQYRLPNGSRENITKEVFPVAIGIKVGVTFGHGRKKEKYGNFDHPPVFRINN
jgi:hypothetical protein